MASDKLLALGAGKNRWLYYIFIILYCHFFFLTTNRAVCFGTMFSFVSICSLPIPSFHFNDSVCTLFFQYLTTVIPYERKGGPPSVEDLQILTKSEPLKSSFTVMLKSLLVIHLLLPSYMTLLLGYYSVCLVSCLVLQAMRDDSDKVPSLLTDYILKGKSN